MRKFRDHLCGRNKHLVRLGEKRIIVDEDDEEDQKNGAAAAATSSNPENASVTKLSKTYRVFALQVSGGAQFPSKDAHPELALNNFLAWAAPLLGLVDEGDGGEVSAATTMAQPSAKSGAISGVEFDIVSVRSCARGVNANNAFRFSAPAANWTMVYGIGGIGMTTAAPNALYMQALGKTRRRLAEGEIDEREFKSIVRESDFGEIPNWDDGKSQVLARENDDGQSGRVGQNNNPFNKNFTAFVDSNPKIIWRNLGRYL